MANNNEQFLAFNDAITVSSTKRSTLQKNRDTLREVIRNYYKKEFPDDVKPKFHQQGSFAMRTILEPIVSEEELGVYDLDDGVYFVSDSNDDKLPESQFHERIYSAVKAHTSKGAENNAPCVTVLYADGHHVDLPIYFMCSYDGARPKLAHLKKGWLESDPREFYKWFNAKVKDNQQLLRIVKYIKAWCNYVEYKNDQIKMPGGCVITILASENFVSSEDRDDVSLKDTLVKMYNSLFSNFVCIRPTYPRGEDLFKDYSDKRKNDFLDKLKIFKENAEKAISSKNPKDACLKWQKCFGDRFSCSNAKDVDEDAKQQKSPGIIIGNSSFA